MSAIPTVDIRLFSSCHGGKIERPVGDWHNYQGDHKQGADLQGVYNFGGVRRVNHVKYVRRFDLNGLDAYNFRYFLSNIGFDTLFEGHL
jgi:hypothetical protein